MTHLNYAVNIPSTGAVDCTYAPGSCKDLATSAPFIALINADSEYRSSLHSLLLPTSPAALSLIKSRILTIACANGIDLAYAGLTAFMIDSCGGKLITANTNAGINGDYNPFNLAKCDKNGVGLGWRARAALKAPSGPHDETR